MKTSTILIVGGAAVAAWYFMGQGAMAQPTMPATDPNADPYGSGGGDPSQSDPYGNGGYYPQNSGYPGAPMMPMQRFPQRRFARNHPHQWKHYGAHPGRWDNRHNDYNGPGYGGSGDVGTAYGYGGAGGGAGGGYALPGSDQGYNPYFDPSGY